MARCAQGRWQLSNEPIRAWFFLWVVPYKEITRIAGFELSLPLLMATQFITLPSDELLRKFGMGDHKPGSGSAAAWQGMLAAQMMCTVITLTHKEKWKKKYEAWLPELSRIKSEIEGRIYPALERLFQEDSVQFGKAVVLRIARDEETDRMRSIELDDKALQELIPSTEMPVEIANLCSELAYFAIFVFDRGFKSARGDSSVALNCAVSGIGGCLSIIDLNLKSFIRDEWTEKIKNEADHLRAFHKSLSSEIAVRIERLQKEAERKIAYRTEIHALLEGPVDESKLTYADIETKARQLQNTMWIHRNKIWKKGVPKDLIGMLKPEDALTFLGYQLNLQTALEEREAKGGSIEIAGIIDKKSRTVTISEQFPPVIQIFTAAHELGHALLHEQSVLHRDAPHDGSFTAKPRNLQEKQADKFASYFLMPRTLIERIFQEHFLLKKFVINEDTVFALNERSPSAFRAKCGDLHGLAKFLASAEYFSLRNFNSIAKKFNVSKEAMAIRLEELRLIEF